MSSQGPDSAFTSDTIPTSPDQDLFGYAVLAERIANNLQALPDSNGNVVAVNGPWGSGKTTLLRLIEYYLQRIQPDPPIIVHFNPWWFSGQHDLTQRFLVQLMIAVRQASTKARFQEKFREASRTLLRLAQVVGKAPIPGASAVEAGAEALFADVQDVPELKEKLGEALAQLSVRVVIMIDDLDRLTPEEMRLVFRLIKTVGDLAHVIHIVAFDKEIAIDALGRDSDLRGAKYLEKIVQIPIELPMPDKATLERLLNGKLELIFANTPLELYDRKRWINLYILGIQHLVRTPRSVIRLSNAVAFTYPSVRGEVNVVDYICLEALRIFVPVAYDVVRKYRALFVGEADAMLQEQDAASLRAFHDAWLNHIVCTTRLRPLRPCGNPR